MSKQPDPNVSTGVSPEWKVWIETIATKTGRNLLQVVYEAIAFSLNENATTIGATTKDILKWLEVVKHSRQ